MLCSRDLSDQREKEKGIDSALWEARLAQASPFWPISDIPALLGQNGRGWPRLPAFLKCRGIKRNRYDWARQMLRVVQRWCPGRQLIVVADSAYAVIRWLSDLQQGQPITVITRLRLDAVLYESAPERPVGQMGRTRLKGNRLPTLACVIQDPETRWERVRLHRWYEETNREVEIVSQTAIWYHTGLPALPVRWVLVRDPKGKFST